jgi:hypothetical protein
MAKIIGSCDLMVTPVHDPDWRKWSANVGEIKDALTDYKAQSFSNYLASAWCRLEMFFNANVKVKADRARYFGGRLQDEMMTQMRRPHLLFGTRELQRSGDMPVIVRHLRDDEFKKYHPGEGKLTKEQDRQVIRAYVQELIQINRNLEVRREMPEMFSQCSCVCVCCMVFILKFRIL